MKKWDTPAGRFGILLLAALLLQFIPFLFTRWEHPMAEGLYFLHLYAVLPLCAALLPCWAGYGGVHPLAGFFPVGGALLLLPVYESPGMGLLCLLLSLVGCVAGQEWKKRAAPEKGDHHGRK